MATLNVVAQGSYVSSDSRLFLNVLVTDHDGTPISGLKKANFKVAQLAPDFDNDIGITLVQDLGATASSLTGVYRVMRHGWTSGRDGTFAFHIRVQTFYAASVGASKTTLRKMSLVTKREGRALAWVVKVKS